MKFEEFFCHLFLFLRGKLSGNSFDIADLKFLPSSLNSTIFCCFFGSSTHVYCFKAVARASKQKNTSLFFSVWFFSRKFGGKLNLISEKICYFLVKKNLMKLEMRIPCLNWPFKWEIFGYWLTGKSRWKKSVILFLKKSVKIWTGLFESIDQPVVGKFRLKSAISTWNTKDPNYNFL